MIRGVLFDMDGVLVDTEEYICRAAIEMFREKGIFPSPGDFLPFVGMGENRYIGGVAEKHGLKIDVVEAKARTYEIYGIIAKGKIIPLPGSAEFVRRCRRSGFRLALATSADRVKMEINLREAGFSENDFDATVNGLEVERKKPFPDIYLEAASRIGINPEECVVIEDAVSGVRAARSAGCKCLAVTTSFSREKLADADWIFGSLAEVPEDIFNT